MPQLAAQDHLGVARPGVQALVEDQLAVAVQPHQLQLAQLLDEATEQRLVEEFRRRRRVQQAQPLRRQLAQPFPLAGAERAGAVLGPHRDRAVVALARLLPRMTHPPKPEHLVALTRLTVPDAATSPSDPPQQPPPD